MKKIIAIAFVTVLTMFGATTTSFAQDSGECAESDNLPIDGVDCTLVDGEYPPVGGEGGTVPAPEVTTTTVAPTTTQPVAGERGTVPPRAPTGALPRTGGSGSSGILQVGALLLVAGVVVFVAARRRNPAATA